MSAVCHDKRVATTRAARRIRLDQLLVDRGLVATRSRAQALVLAGKVRVGQGDAARADRKPGDLVDVAEPLRVDTGGEWVSRGAHKLLAALDALGIDPAGRVAIDVAFISLGLVLGPVRSVLRDGAGPIVALVKPQFEVGRAQVGKGGVVRGWEARRDAVRGVALAAAGIGLRVGGVSASVLHGPKGNREVFLYLARDLGSRPRLEGPGLETALAAAIEAEGRAT